jgi:hypothetical protein
VSRVAKQWATTGFIIGMGSGAAAMAIAVMLFR